jgi:hypothetical protein
MPKRQGEVTFTSCVLLRRRVDLAGLLPFLWRNLVSPCIKVPTGMPYAFNMAGFLLARPLTVLVVPISRLSMPFLWIPLYYTAQRITANLLSEVCNSVEPHHQ